MDYLHRRILDLADNLCQSAYVDGVCDGAWDKSSDYDEEALKLHVDDIARLECWHEGHKHAFSAALREVLKGFTWTPIEDAPRAGTPVDLLLNGTRRSGYWWDENRKAWITHIGYPVVTNILVGQPSHFMLIPPAA